MGEFMDYIKEIAAALNYNHAVAMIGAGFSESVKLMVVNFINPGRLKINRFVSIQGIT